MTAPASSQQTNVDRPMASAQDVFPFVSIVMPIRNEAHFIAENIRRLISQDYPQDKLEIIVADGMSNDGTREIVAKLAKEMPHIRMIDNSGQIVPTGLNAAIRAARGNIVIRVDGHVDVATDFVRCSVELLQSQPLAWGGGGPIVHAGKNLFARAVAAAMSHPAGVGNAAHRFADHEGFAEGAAFPAFHRWVFDKIGFFDETLVRNQDDEFNYRVVMAGGKIYVSPKVRYVYYVRDTIGKLAKQFFQYSFWRIPVMKKHRRPTTFRQIVPSLFFVTLLVAFVVGCYFRQPVIALALPTLYLGAVVCVGISLIPEYNLTIGLLVPVALLTMHTSYAAGMLYGLLAAAVFPSAWSHQGRMSQLSR
jgi:succinoglycan biosynthesis protein ExoA